MTLYFVDLSAEFVVSANHCEHLLVAVVAYLSAHSVTTFSAPVATDCAVFLVLPFPPDFLSYSSATASSLVASQRAVCPP